MRRWHLIMIAAILCLVSCTGRKAHDLSGVNGVEDLKGYSVAVAMGSSYDLMLSEIDSVDVIRLGVGELLVAVEKGVVIAANIWGKLKTVVQMLMVILMIGNFGGFLAALTQIFKWAALLLTLISLATYLFQNRKVLNEEV